jgi:histidyl-tRNA synthetase
VDRIYDVLEELNRFPPDLKTGTQVLFFNLGEKESEAAFTLLQQVRERGISGELYPEYTKFDKQFKYADKKNIPYVVIMGEEELNSGSCKVKNTRSGEQQSLPAEIVAREFPFI